MIDQKILTGLATNPSCSVIVETYSVWNINHKYVWLSDLKLGEACNIMVIRQLRYTIWYTCIIGFEN